MKVPVAVSAKGHEVTLIMYGRVSPAAHAFGYDVMPVQVADDPADLTARIDYHFICVFISI
jgi:hypothetical protein